MKKPLIAVMPQFDTDTENYKLVPAYIKAILDAGGLPMIIPFTNDKADIEQIAAMFDAFLFTGGQDIDPSLYGEEKQEYCDRIVCDRDTLDISLMKEVAKTDKPVFGICRGLQVMNVAFGGTLYQDIPTQCNSKVLHRMEEPFDRVAHTVDIVENTPLIDIVNTKTIGVNTIHHQAIKDVAPKLEVTAISEDGIIEGVYMPGKKFFMATQWHPELTYFEEESSKKIITAFVNAAKEN